MSACPLVVLACESSHVCTVCIWRCEHARFCVEGFYALYIHFHSFIIHCQFHLSKQWYGCQCLGFLRCMQMLMHVIAFRGCMSLQESALKIDPGRKIHAHMGDSVPCQHCLSPGFSVGCSTN